MTVFEDDRRCFACGELNELGLKLKFQWDGQTLTTEFTPAAFHQGYKGIVHGGILATVLDEVMAWAAIKKFQRLAATAEVSVRFKNPLKTGEAATASARVTGSTRRLVEAEGEIMRNSDGVNIATASAKLILI